MRKTILFVSALIAMLFAAGWYFHKPDGARAQTVVVDRDLAKFMPPETNSLMGVDVSRLKKSAVYQFLEKEGGSKGQGFEDSIEKFVAVTGFDPRRDVHKLLIASWGDPMDLTMRPDLNFLAAARGSFDIQSLDEVLTVTAQATAEHRGYRVYHYRHHIPVKKKGSQAQPESATDIMWFSVAFLDGTSALAGPRSAVLDALDRRLDGGASLAANTELLRLAAKIPSSNQIWGVSEQPGKLVPEKVQGQPGKNNPATRILQTMQTSTFALDLMEGFDLQAEGVFTSAEDAKLLGDAARGLIAMGRLSIAGENPGLMIFLDSIAVSEADTNVKVSVQIDMLSFRLLMESLKAKQPGLAQAL